jgi:hypothetical protein
MCITSRHSLVMLLMDESYHDILFAVLRGNATPSQHAAFNTLLQTNPGFRLLYEQLRISYNHKPASPVFDADRAFEKMKKRLGK